VHDQQNSCGTAAPGGEFLSYYLCRSALRSVSGEIAQRQASIPRLVSGHDFSRTAQTCTKEILSAEGCAQRSEAQILETHPFAKLKKQGPACAKEWGTHFLVRDTEPEV